MADKLGEVYFLGEVELDSTMRTPFVKIGLVRSNAKNRTTEDRLTEHQTGNPRHIVELAVLETPEADRVESLLHKVFASWRVSGEWFDLQNDRLDLVLAEGTRIVALVGVESDLLAQAKAIEMVPSSGDKLPADSNSRDVARRAIVARRGQTFIDAIEGRVVAALLAASHAGRDVTRYLAVQINEKAATFDTTKFKKEHPDLYDAFSTPNTAWSKTFVPAKMKALGLDDSVLDADLLDLCARIDVEAAAVETGASLDSLHKLYLELLQFDARYDLEFKAAEAQLKLLCGTAPGIEGLCTWNRHESHGMTFDKDAFKAQYPDVYAKYEKPARTKESHVLAKDRGYRNEGFRGPCA